MTGITCDAGGLIALDRNDRQVLVLLARAVERGMRISKSTEGHELRLGSALRGEDSRRSVVPTLTPKRAALDACTHVRVEKAMAFTVDHARHMRATFERAGARAVRIGHQFTSSIHTAGAARFLQPDFTGKVTFIQARIFRNWAAAS